MLLSPGQAGDNPMLAPLLQAHPDRLTGDKRLLADKAYSHNSTRADLRKRKTKHTIPERSMWFPRNRGGFLMLLFGREQCFRS